MFNSCFNFELKLSREPEHRVPPNPHVVATAKQLLITPKYAGWLGPNGWSGLAPSPMLLEVVACLLADERRLGGWRGDS